MTDFLFRGSLQDLDPEVEHLNQLEAARQYRRLILIPSESTSPVAVREALSSAFHNIYAEGYPDEESRWMPEEDILDYTSRLAHYRRYSDPRYYKGTEYADTVEALARRRCAETFAANGVSADDLYVNVQALSGGPANNAVYHALVQPGDTVMGMNLMHGGHLSHGSPVNRSGKYFNIVSYTVDPETERIDYEAIHDLAAEAKPKMIIGGFSSYPWKADWAALRAIADSIGAYLLADIAHVAGLVAGGVYPSPVGHAHVITSTTHKTLCGPRGAIILTSDRVLARKIDRAVFPGEQGGPHVNVFSALALTFKLAQTKEFKNLQEQIVKNCAAFTAQLQKRGFRIPFGGTDTHLMNLDCKSVTGPDDVPLSGDMAARILDLAGTVVNRNTIPGDKSALNPSGIRMGTPWITQRGFKEKETTELADIIADLLLAAKPYRLPSRRIRSQRAKIDFSILEDAKQRIRQLAESAGIDFEPGSASYPHYYFIDDDPLSKGDTASLSIRGHGVRDFLQFALALDIDQLSPGDSSPTTIETPQKTLNAVVTNTDDRVFVLSIGSSDYGLAAAWLRSLSDGFIPMDEDLLKKSPGPVVVEEIEPQNVDLSQAEPGSSTKPFFIGIPSGSGEPLPEFKFQALDSNGPLPTPLQDAHLKLGAKMAPFAGWDMPLRYSSVAEEHQAVRQAAGLFDVTHMGVFRAHGPQAQSFLNCVCTNDIGILAVGEAAYSHFLDPHAAVIDDLFVYRTGDEEYLLVVNAANHAKDWDWLQAVLSGEVLVDLERPWSKVFGRGVELSDLQQSSAGKAALVLLALQGPRSKDVLLDLKSSPEDQKKLGKLLRNDLYSVTLEGIPVTVARTGYTGEKIGYELFVHPSKAASLWNSILKVGAPYDVKPCGLAARDSLRTEAGLPLYGNEMGGTLGLGVAEAGFRTFVKTYKPWFIGRQAFLEREQSRTTEIVRFQFDHKGVRPAHTGDPVLDTRGRVIGRVTSCALDSEGRLTGQACIARDHRAKGTPLLIYQNAAKLPDGSPSKLTPGEKLAVPSPASVVSRFL